MRDLDYVRDMDVLTFNSVTAIMTKLVYREKSENAQVGWMAAQGSKESMQSLIRTWQSATGDGQNEAPNARPAAGSGAMAFLKALKIHPGKGGRF